MKRIFRMLGLSLVVIAILTVAFVGTVSANNSELDGPGPAPNSGDSDPDGSGFDHVDSPGAFGNVGSGSGPVGPAPNSGDGDPDGSGF